MPKGRGGGKQPTLKRATPLDTDGAMQKAIKGGLAAGVINKGPAVPARKAWLAAGKKEKLPPELAELKRLRAARNKEIKQVLTIVVVAALLFVALRIGVEASRRASDAREQAAKEQQQQQLPSFSQHDDAKDSFARDTESFGAKMKRGINDGLDGLFGKAEPAAGQPSRPTTIDEKQAAYWAKRRAQRQAIKSRASVKCGSDVCVTLDRKADGWQAVNDGYNDLLGSFSSRRDEQIVQVTNCAHERDDNIRIVQWRRRFLSNATGQQMLEVRWTLCQWDDESEASCLPPPGAASPWPSTVREYVLPGKGEEPLTLKERAQTRALPLGHWSRGLHIRRLGGLDAQCKTLAEYAETGLLEGAVYLRVGGWTIGGFHGSLLPSLFFGALFLFTFNMAVQSDELKQAELNHGELLKQAEIKQARRTKYLQEKADDEQRIAANRQREAEARRKSEERATAARAKAEAEAFLLAKKEDELAREELSRERKQKQLMKREWEAKQQAKREVKRLRQQQQKAKPAARGGGGGSGSVQAAGSGANASMINAMISRSPPAALTTAALSRPPPAQQKYRFARSGRCRDGSHAAPEPAFAAEASCPLPRQFTENDARHPTNKAKCTAAAAAPPAAAAAETNEIVWDDDDAAAALPAAEKAERERFARARLARDEKKELARRIALEEAAQASSAAKLLALRSQLSGEEEQEPDVPSDLQCSISHELMVDPVVAADGNSYERSAIETWFTRGKRTSPLTNEEMPHVHLLPNLALRKLCQDFSRNA